MQVRPSTRAEFAIKFDTAGDAFAREADLYKDPQLRDMMPATAEVTRSGTAVHARSGFVFPPAIVIERGESLSEWHCREQPDFITNVQVRCFLALLAWCAMRVSRACWPYAVLLGLICSSWQGGMLSALDSPRHKVRHRLPVPARMSLPGACWCDLDLQCWQCASRLIRSVHCGQQQRAFARASLAVPPGRSMCSRGVLTCAAITCRC